MSLVKPLFVVLLTLTTVYAQRCPALVFPNILPDNCQAFVATGDDGCRTILLACNRNNRNQCTRSNEIFYQCSNECEPTCREPLPNCNARCAEPKCQCRPNFLRDAVGNCVPPNQCGVRGLDCLFDQQCGFGRKCDNRQCVDRPPQRDRPFCRFDRECFGNGECVRGQCRRRSGRCNNSGDCFGGQVCINAFCVDVVRDLFDCNSDRDCRPGNECRRGRCQPRQRDEGCNGDRDCGPFEACIRNRCIRRSSDRGECHRDRDCDDDQTCDNGRCVRRNRGRCHFDRDCSRRQNCVFGRCVGGDFGPGHGSGGDRPGGGRPGGDRPGGDRPGGGRPGGDRPGGDRPGGGRPGEDRPGGDRPGGDRPGGGRPGGGRPGGDRGGGRGDGRDSRGGLRQNQDGDQIRHDATGCDEGCDGPGQVCRNGRCVNFNGDDITQDRVTAVPSLPEKPAGKDSIVLIGTRNNHQVCVPDCPIHKLCINGNCVTL